MELNGSLKNFSLPDIVQLIGTTRQAEEIGRQLRDIIEESLA